MSNTSIISELLERAQLLLPGEKLTVKTESFLEMESTRTALLREKAKLEEQGISFKNIIISRNSDRKAKTYRVCIYRLKGNFSITLEKATGEKENLSLSCSQEENNSELDRICRLMKEDGASDEEIAAYQEGFKNGDHNN